MPESHRTAHASLEWLDSGLPYSPRYGDIYHSQYQDSKDREAQAGALEESDQVFVLASDLKRRWGAHTEAHNTTDSTRSFLIAELGFGCGINFLRTWQHWKEYGDPHRQLYYLGIENAPLRLEDLRRVLALWPQLGELSEQLLASYEGHSRGLHRFRFQHDRLTLDLCFEDAEQFLSSRDPALHNYVDCWYLDGFSPNKNPDMWSEPLLKQVGRNSRKGSTVCTYSVAGKVRNPLTEVGFEVSKQPGFANKRHRLSAIFTGHSTSGQHVDWMRKQQRPTWLGISSRPAKKNSRILVVGAGLAGCSTARALADRGYRVTVIDSAEAVASVGSANPQATLHLSLRHRVNADSGFYLQGYLFSRRQFQDFATRGTLHWQSCGVLQTSAALNSKKRRSITDYLSNYPEPVLKHSDASESCRGIAQHLRHEALFLPLSGWLSIPELCQNYLQSSLIDVQFETRLLELSKQDDGWLVKMGNGKSASFSTVVLANSAAVKDLEQCSSLPLNQSWGQVTQIAEIEDTAFSMRDMPVLCDAKTLSPTSAGRQTISASYQPDSSSVSREIANKENIAGMSELFADPNLRRRAGGLAAVGWVNSYRGSSEDFNPLVGAVIDSSRTAALYSDLHKLGPMNHRIVNIRPQYHEGLYCNVGHGSHGLSSCPLSAEFLASMICGSPAPISSAQADILNPIRFLMRNLRRNAWSDGEIDGV